MRLSLRLEPRLELKQDLRLMRIIDTSNLLAVPDEVFSILDMQIACEPDYIEDILVEHKRKKSTFDVAEKVQALYPQIVEPKQPEDKPKHGLIIAPTLTLLEDVIGDHDTTITPDVTYFAREGYKPKVEYSEHLIGPRMSMRLQLDRKQYPETSFLLKQLKRFNDWKRKTLREIYVVVGDVQREYFEKLDKGQLHSFNQERLGEKMGISAGTICKMMTNRFVEIQELSGSTELMYAKDLLVTSDRVKMYASFPKINAVLEEEFEKGVAFSDQEIARRIPNVARRTIAKYRKNSGIPGNGDRKRSYANGLEKAYAVG